jgi:hypothetical protein
MIALRFTLPAVQEMLHAKERAVDELMKMTQVAWGPVNQVY